MSEPPAIFSQVPLGTLSQASVWASFFEVPAHDELAVWQSFLPALAMPKHFSVAGACACACAASSSALLSAAAMVSVVFIDGLLRGNVPFGWAHTAGPSQG